MMSGMARNSLPLDPGCGTEFYNFEDVTDVKVRQRVVTPAWPDAVRRIFIHHSDNDDSNEFQ